MQQLEVNAATRMCVMFNRADGSTVSKELMLRIPDPGELVYFPDRKYKVTSVATMLGDTVAKVYSGYNMRAVIYIVYIKPYIDGIG